MKIWKFTPPSINALATACLLAFVMPSAVNIFYMDQFVNQNVNLVLVGQQSHNCSYYWLALAKGFACQYHIFLADHRAITHLKKKNLQMPGAARRCPREGLGTDWLLQYLYDNHVHLHETDKGSFYLFNILLSTAANHAEKLKSFSRSSWYIKFRGSSLHSTYLTRIINVPVPPSKCLSITRLSTNNFLRCLNMTRAVYFYVQPKHCRMHDRDLAGELRVWVQISHIIIHYVRNSHCDWTAENSYCL